MGSLPTASISCRLRSDFSRWPRSLRERGRRTYGDARWKDQRPGADACRSSRVVAIHPAGATWTGSGAWHAAGNRTDDQPFASYSGAALSTRDPSRSGYGAIEGVAGPEAADNAAALTHFVPMLTLGIPAGAPMALMLGALMIQVIAPGPLVMVQHADLFWGTIASMWIGNASLLVLNLPGWWVCGPVAHHPASAALSERGGVLLHRRIQCAELDLDVETAAAFGIAGYVFQVLTAISCRRSLVSFSGRSSSRIRAVAFLISRKAICWPWVLRPISGTILAGRAGSCWLSSTPRGGVAHRSMSLSLNAKVSIHEANAS